MRFLRLFVALMFLNAVIPTIIPARAETNNPGVPGVHIPIGTDLRTTGGTSEVLLQTTTGGPLSVRQLTCSDLSSGCVASTGTGSMTGPLGIGTSPSARLHVVESTTNDALIIENSNAALTNDVARVDMTAEGDSSAYNLLRVYNTSGTALFVRGDRRVGVGGVTSPAYPLDVLGDINSSGIYHGSLNGTTVTPSGATTSVSLVNLAARIVSVLDFGAVCNGSTNDATAIQAAINYLASNGGGIVLIPSQSCKFTSTLSITSAFTTIQGVNNRSSILLCATGASDCIDVTGVSTSSQIYGVWLRNLHLLGSSLTGGSGVNMRFVGSGGLEHVLLDNIYNGFALSGANDIMLRDTNITTTAGSGRWGILWYSAAGGERSDALTLDHVTIQENFGGADCMLWNNYTNTLRVFGGNMLGCSRGLRINTTGDTSNYPQFLQADDIEIDSATNYALTVEGPTQQLWITNSQLTANGSTEAVAFQGFVEAAGITNSRILGRNCGASVGAGSYHVSFVGDNFNSSTTCEVNDSSGLAQVIGGIGHTGLPLGIEKLSHGNATPTPSSCGSGATVTGTSTQGFISTGTGTVTSCTMNFATNSNFTTTPVCVPVPSNTAFTASVTSINTGGVTFSFSTSIPTTAVYYRCSD